MKLRVILIAALAALGSLVAVPTPAQAVDRDVLFFGSAGGTQVTVLGGVVDAQPTASSAIGCTGQAPLSTSASTATVNLPKVLVAGLATSKVATSNVFGGVQLVSTARTAKVNVLNGLITADAVETTATSRKVNGVVSGATNTKFLNLKIAGVKVNANPGPNFGVNLPKIAKVQLNVQQVVAGHFGGPAYRGAGVLIELLAPVGALPAGARIIINPVYAEIANGFAVPPGTGNAFGVSVQAAVGDAVTANVGPLGAVGINCLDADGVLRTDRVVSLPLAPLLNLGVIETTGRGVLTQGFSSVTMTSRVADVNLLNGLIRADVLGGVASVTQAGEGPVQAFTATTLTNLVIDGHLIPIDVSPNTVIEIPGIARVTINHEERTADSAEVRVLDVVLLAPFGSLSTGARIQVGYAKASLAD